MKFNGTMTFRKILIVMAVAIVSVGTFSCGSDKSKGDHDTGEQNSELTAALQSHDMKRASAIADSMAMYIDELTPDETVTVLMAFLQIHNDAAAAGERQRDLETIRKFVDVYEIASSLNPNDFKAAVIRTNQLNPNLNFAQIFEDFRDKLAEYEATSGEPEPEPEKAANADSASAGADNSQVPDIVKPNEGDEEEIPVEHRPAE